MTLVVLCLVLERFKSHHLLFNFFFIKRHQLKGKEFPDELGDQVFMVEFSGVVSLNNVHQIDFFVRVGRNEKVDHEVLEGNLLLVAGGIDSGLLLRS